MRIFISTLIMAVNIFGFSAAATMPYVELPCLNGGKPAGKIEVEELFSYRCGHCFNLEPALTLWADSLPDDVVFKRVPAMFGGQWDELGHLFLTLEMMGAPPEVHRKVFHAVQKRQRLSTDEEMANFVETAGMDRDRFLATLHSFAVKGKVQAAKNKVKEYKISAVPTMIVNNKYTFDLSVGGAEKMFNLANDLINKERSTQVP